MRCEEIWKKYRIVRIPKKGRGFRTLHVPDDDLKAKQRELLRHMYRTGIGASPFAFGFVRRKGVKEHASAHVGRKYVVRIDIKDFFPSTGRRVILNGLSAEGYGSQELDIMRRENDVPLERIPPPQSLFPIAMIPTSYGSAGLPQGSPLSPYLSNIAMKAADYRITALLEKRGPKDARYTRYADDIVLSSDSPEIVPLSKPVVEILKSYEYRANRAKFRVMRRTGRQSVCGVVVNEKLNLPREKRRMYRARLDRLFKILVHGWDMDKAGNRKEVVRDDLARELKHVIGFFSWARYIARDYYKKHSRKLEAVSLIAKAKGLA